MWWFWGHGLGPILGMELPEFEIVWLQSKMFNHLGSAALLGRDWLHAPKQYRTIVEARKLVWSEYCLNESGGMWCSHQNGVEKQVPQRMDHSKEQLMKNKIKNLHWTSKKCFWNPELYLIVLWGHGDTLFVPTTNQISLASVSKNPIILSRVAWQQLVLKSWVGVFFQFSSLTFAQVKYHFFKWDYSFKIQLFLAVLLK